MGGHRGGEVASRLAVEGIQKFCKENPDLNPRERLTKGVNQSCQEIYRQSKMNEELSGMGTTVLALLIHQETAYIAQVGDSRVYLLNTDGIWQVTEDHSLLNEEIRAGRIDRDQAHNYQFKNVITRSVGYQEEEDVDSSFIKLEDQDLLLLCSDGLHGKVSNRELSQMIKKHEIASVNKLVELANNRGGDDNISIVIVKIQVSN